MPEMNSPEGAEIYLEQDLFDAANPDGVMAISVHKREENSHCNIWIKLQGEWIRLIDERVLEGHEPSLNMANGELLRLAIAKRDQINADLRLKLAIMGLTSAIEAEREKKA